MTSVFVGKISAREDAESLADSAPSCDMFSNHVQSAAASSVVHR